MQVIKIDKDTIEVDGKKYKAVTDPYAHLKKAWDDGKGIRCGGEYHYKSDGWQWNWNQSPGLYEIEPEPKIIDLSVLIESGIDCEFSDDGESWGIGTLDKNYQSGLYLYQDVNNFSWRYCRPRMNHPHHWEGGACPLPEGFKIELTFRNGEKIVVNNEYFIPRWAHWNTDGDIIAFRVLKIADGWKMPWEVKDENS